MMVDTVRTYLGRTTDQGICVSYTWLVDYDVVHPVYGPMTVTGCYNLYLGLASFIPEYSTKEPSGMTEDIRLAYMGRREHRCEPTR